MVTCLFEVSMAATNEPLIALIRIVWPAWDDLHDGVAFRFDLPQDIVHVVEGRLFVGFDIPIFVKDALKLNHGRTYQPQG